jgi:hypothetical protein
LLPDDLVAMMATCKAFNSHIRMDKTQVKANLLKKTLCPGLGLAARLANQCPCKTRGWHSYAGCGGDGHDVSSKPCVVCGINTCDECRIHVVYQTFMEDPGLNSRRWWAGYLLDFPYPFSLLPPEGNADASWHLPEDLTRSHHDEGRFHIPLHVGAIADPEPLDRILDMNLGCHTITPFGRTAAPFDGENVVSFFEAAASSRRELLCLPCVEQHRRNNFKPCSCTFRRHFLDRWTCLPCHAKETKQEAQMRMTRIISDPKEPHGHAIACRCGTRITQNDDYEAICLWCSGLIPDSNGDDDSNENDAKDFRNNDDEEDNAGPAPTDLMAAHALIPVDNKDGTMAVYFNGVRISGERLSRAMVQTWASNKGVDIPCSCCKCPTRVCDHHHHHDHHHDHSDEDEYAGADDTEDWEDTDEEMVGDDEDGAIFRCCDDDDSDAEVEVDPDSDVEPDVYEDE